MMEEARCIIYKLEQINLLYDFREANHMVDRLIYEAMNLEEYKVWEANFPKKYKLLVKEDRDEAYR